MAPPSTRVTATLANAAERRSIFGQYAQTPIYYTPVTVGAPLDEKGCLAVELPLTEAKVLSVGPQREVKLFLEPGDQLHIDADLLDLPQSLRFSGQGAANNQFLAALRSRFSDYLRINYKDLEVDAFRKMIDQRRLEMTRFLDEGCNLHPRRSPGPKRLPERFQRPSDFLGLLGELVRSLHRGSTPSGRAQTADPRPEGGLFEHLFGSCRRVAPSSR